MGGLNVCENNKNIISMYLYTKPCGMWTKDRSWIRLSTALCTYTSINQYYITNTIINITLLILLLYTYANVIY